MSGERNRRTLAFRYGGGSSSGPSSASAAPPAQPPTTTTAAVLAVPMEEPAIWPPLQLNGRLREEEEVGLGPSGLDDDEEAEAAASDLPRRPAADGASLSSSSSGSSGSSSSSEEDDEEEEEDEEEEGGGSPASGLSGRPAGDCAEEAEERPVRRLGLAPARPQSLLHSLHGSFQDSWLQEFPWLGFCQETGLMSCAWCRPQEGGGGRDELAKGTRNYKRPLLLRHHLSAEHRLNDPASQKPEIKEEVSESYSDFSVKPNENSYCYQLLHELNEQRKKGILCDVNIVVSGKVFRAHKNILVAGSRFFKTLYCFTNKESRDQTTVTYLDVVAIRGFSVILDFMYSGNLMLTSQNAIEVMSVASYLQMTEVVSSCRNFIKDALNINTKMEATEAMLTNCNKVKGINRDSLSVREQKLANFWATRNLTNLASNIKIENDIPSPEEGQTEDYQQNNSTWVQTSPPEVNSEPEGQGKVFVWNDVASHSTQEPSKGRRKNQATKRFVYNVPPTADDDLLEGSEMLLPFPEPYQDDDLQGLQDSAGTSSELKGGLFSESWPKETWENGTSCDVKYGMFRESWPREEWENGDPLSSGLMDKLKCPHCSYVAKYRRTLKRHLLIHTGVRSFSCDICGKLFTRREHVKRHSLVHKKDKKYKCMVCKKIFMLAASVGIRHGSRRYGVCVDCVDKSQPGMQDGVDQIQDPDFSRDEDYDENDAAETVDADDLVEEVEDQNDPTQWDERHVTAGWEEQTDPSRWEELNEQSRWEQSAHVCMTVDD